MATKGKGYLTPSEMEKLLKAAQTTEYPKRDHCLILICYRHGLRVSELIHLKVSDISLEDATIHIKRSKKGLSTSHPLKAEELRALKAHLKARDSKSPYLFLTERKTPFHRVSINYLVSMIAKKAKLGFHVHPHMLRHSCGYYLANEGFDTRIIQDYLGHRDIKSTVRYTQVNPARFQELFK